jgi:hypothetical protein
MKQMKQKYSSLFRRVAAVLLAAPFLLTASCNLEEDPVFDRSAAVRMQEALQNADKLLRSAEKGWLVEYYPEENHAVGAYVMYWNFQAREVTMACEVSTGSSSPAYSEHVSQWKLVTDQSLVLSFDTYNPVLHYWCDQTNVSGALKRVSDYEFVVLKTEGDSAIYVRGKKYDNKMVLRRFSDDADPIEYLQQTTAMFRKVIANNYYLIVNGTDTIGRAALTVANQKRVFTVTYQKPGSTINTNDLIPFAYNPAGIRLYEPYNAVHYKSETDSTRTLLSRFDWNPADSSFVCSDPEIDAKFVKRR